MLSGPYIKKDTTLAMKSALQVNDSKVSAVGFQEASMDIWDKKYRLKTKSGEVVDETG